MTSKKDISQLEDKISMLERSLRREREARKLSERILEEKSKKLWETNQELLSLNASLEDLVKIRTERIEDLFENMHDCLIVLDEHAKITEANKAARDLLGYSEKEIKEIEVSDIVYEEDIEISKQFFEILLAEGYYENYEGRIVSKDGTIKFVQVNSNAIFDEAGNFKGSRDIVRDISERKEFEKAFLINNARFKTLLESLSTGILLVNEQGTIVLSNQQFCKTFGISEGPDYLIDKNCFEEVPHFTQLILDGDTFEKSMIEVIDKREVVIGEEIHFKNSKIYERDFYPIIGDDKYLGHLWQYHDVTESRNHDIKRESLLVQLEKANLDLKEFAHIVSHDLKAPLRAISSISDWLSEDYKEKLGEEGIQQVHLIKQRANRMQNLISGLLDYTKVGTAEIRMEKLDMDKELHDLIVYLNPPAHFSIEIQEDIPEIYSDQLRIQQIFQNLISNSIKYNDKDKGLIKIEYEHSEHHRFKVIDNGPGIDKKYHEKIFQIFQTLSARDAFESTGVGLSIVKKIVELLEGSIEIESEVGKGTTFIINLPIT